MSIKPRDVYTARYFRHGNSYVVLIPPDIRELMSLNNGDILLMNFQHGILWAAKATPGMIASRERVSKIFDDLFGAKEETHARE